MYRKAFEYEINLRQFLITLQCLFLWMVYFMFISMRKLLLCSLLINLVACASLEEHPEPSEEAAAVLLTEEKDHLHSCLKLKKVVGYGTFDDEVHNDIRHQAAVKQQANAVLLLETNVFYQNQRLSNYLRTPKMDAPYATTKYYFEDAFTLKAKGIAYRCP